VKAGYLNKNAYSGAFMLLQGLYFLVKHNFNIACDIQMYTHDKGDFKWKK